MSLNSAAGIIRGRTLNSDAYRRDFDAVVEAVRATVAGKTVDEMRALGGFSTVIRDAIDRLASKENTGSELWPWSVSIEMKHHTQDIRLAATSRRAK